MYSFELRWGFCGGVQGFSMPMNIAFFVDSFPKISETFILNQITGLCDMGHSVEIFARRDSQEDMVHQEVQKYNLVEKTHYADAPANKIRRFKQANLTIANHIVERPRRVIESLRFHKYGRDAYSLRLLFYAANFEDKDFDVLFCHFGRNGNLGALLKQTGVNARLVTMFHGYDVRLEKDKASKLYRPIFEHGDLFLANSKETQRRIVEYGANPEKVVHHPVGVDPEDFESNTGDSLDSHTGNIVITTVGRLTKIKGHEYSIRALSEVINRNPDLALEYRIVGGGARMHELKELTDRLQIQNSVKFFGQVDRATVQDHLNNTDIFLLPSVDEGLGMVLLEAQASGVPIIATDTGGIPEAVNPGESAFLVPPKDPAAIAARLEHLCKHPDLWEPMGDAGRQYVADNYDINTLVDELEDLFKDIVTHQPQSSQ